MKKLLTLLMATVTITAANAQKLSGDTFTTLTNQTVSVNDTVKIGLPMSGQSAYMFIENKTDKKIKKAGKAAEYGEKVGGVLGLGGLKGAMTGLKVGRAARNAKTVTEAADVINGSGIIKPEQKLVITKLYKGDDDEYFAEATNLKSSKFTIKISQALMVKEIVNKDVSIYEQEKEDDNEN